MVHFITREDLLQWLEKNCTRKAVVRALQEGTVEYLGAFTKLGPNSRPGWIVRVTSETGRIWHAEIVAEGKRYGIFIHRGPKILPWKYWDGIEDPLDEIASESPMPLYDGDNPVRYARFRDEWRAEM